MGNKKTEPEVVDSELSSLLRKASELRVMLDEIEREKKALNERYDAMSIEILKYLELADIENIKAHGYLFYKQTKTSVAVPKTIDEKKELFKFLEDKNIFYETVSVNCQTLNSLYKTYAEEALQGGILELQMPGVGAPKSFTTLKIRRG
jgi:effector-binding domain-containing protein